MAETFRSRLAEAIQAKGPLCAGIDPSASVLERWGLEDSAAGATEFALACLDAVGDCVAAVKPNAAFFEQYGSAGLAGLEELLAAARRAGVISIADAKRGDIASTNEAYARAWLDPKSALRADALTVSPYLGTRALSPFVDAAQRDGRGIFVVVRSSNSEGRALQRRRDRDGPTLEEAVLAEATAEHDTVGAVIGLMAGEPPLPLPERSFYLVPGLWAQGASLDDLAAQRAGMGSAPAVVNLSRSLADAGPDPAALRAAATRARDEIARVVRPASG